MVDSRRTCKTTRGIETFSIAKKIRAFNTTWDSFMIRITYHGSGTTKLHILNFQLYVKTPSLDDRRFHKEKQHEPRLLLVS